MTKDEALAFDLALEALEKLTDTEQSYEALDNGDKAITAIRQARAAPVQVLQRYSPDGEGGMEVDSLGVYVKHQDVSNPPAAQRQWVGLTDEEISEIAIKNPPMVHEFARAIEAKLKEKNNGGSQAKESP